MTKKDNYTQMCVWAGTMVGKLKTQRKEFVDFMKTRFNIRVKYVEEIKTAPDYQNRQSVKGTGGRNDLFFLIHNDDIPKFTINRLQYGIRWLEDVLNNEKGVSKYPVRVIDYRTW